MKRKLYGLGWSPYLCKEYDDEFFPVETTMIHRSNVYVNASVYQEDCFAVRRRVFTKDPPVTVSRNSKELDNSELWN